MRLYLVVLSKLFPQTIVYSLVIFYFSFILIFPTVFDTCSYITVALKSMLTYKMHKFIKQNLNQVRFILNKKNTTSTHFSQNVSHKKVSFQIIKVLFVCMFKSVLYFTVIFRHFKCPNSFWGHCLYFHFSLDSSEIEMISEDLSYKVTYVICQLSVLHIIHSVSCLYV